MTIKEVIDQHTGQIIFYPFCGNDFDFILQFASHPISECNVLYIYCTVSSDLDYDILKVDRTKLIGSPMFVNNLNEEIISLFHVSKDSIFKLDDTNNSKIDVSFCEFELEVDALDSIRNQKLMFVFGEVFDFANYLHSNNIDLKSMNIVLRNTGDFKKLHPLMDLFHPRIKTNKKKFIITYKDVWENDITNYYRHDGIYQYKNYFSEYTSIIYYDNDIININVGDVGWVKIK